MPGSEEKSPNMPALISMKNVAVGYGERVILEEVDLDVHSGEVCALLGGSGCGKSTLFKAMVGLVAPQAGEVTIEGEPVIPLAEGHSETMLRKIGVLFQSAGLFPL